MEKPNNNQIIELMTLSDEITSISRKVKQMVENLHSTSQHIGNLKSLTDTLIQKTSKLDGGVDNYKPQQITDDLGNDLEPSWKSNGMEHERITITPENFNEYQHIDEAGYVPTQTNTVVNKKPTMDELQNQQFESLKYGNEEEESEGRKQIVEMQRLQAEQAEKRRKLQEFGDGAVSVSKKNKVVRLPQQPVKKNIKRVDEAKKLTSVPPSERKKVTPPPRAPKRTKKKRTPLGGRQPNNG